MAPGGQSASPWRPVRLTNSPGRGSGRLPAGYPGMGRRRQRLCFARVPPVHLGPGRPAGDRDQEKPSARGLPRVDLQQSQPRRAPVATPQGMARRRNPLRENRPILHGRALPCRHLRLDQERLQAITGPSPAGGTEPRMTESPLIAPIIFHLGPVPVTLPVVTTWGLMAVLTAVCAV